MAADDASNNRETASDLSALPAPYLKTSCLISVTRKPSATAHVARRPVATHSPAPSRCCPPCRRHAHSDTTAINTSTTQHPTHRPATEYPPPTLKLDRRARPMCAGILEATTETARGDVAELQR